jgi:hypothetical protein
VNWFKQWMRVCSGAENEMAVLKIQLERESDDNRRRTARYNGVFKQIHDKQLPPVSGCPDWTVEHAKQWRTFLLTPAGHDLLARARAREASLAITEASDLDAPRICRGMTFTLNWLESLANVELISASAAANAEQSEDETEHVATSNERSKH